MNLSMAQEGREYIIQAIDTDDEDLNAFLFSLGCYSGEPILLYRTTTCSKKVGFSHLFTLHKG